MSQIAQPSDFNHVGEGGEEDNMTEIWELLSEAWSSGHDGALICPSLLGPLEFEELARCNAKVKFYDGPTADGESRFTVEM